MEFSIEKMKPCDFEEVMNIYKQGIDIGIATFQTAIPTYDEWNKLHHDFCRFVAKNEQNVICGFVVLSPLSARAAYSGVAEVSIYVANAVKELGAGTKLLQKVIEVAPAHGIWTLESHIIRKNKPSLALHRKCGFRVVGIRQQIARDLDGVWQDAVLEEYRFNEI